MEVIGEKKSSYFNMPDCPKCKHNYDVSNVGQCTGYDFECDDCGEDFHLEEISDELYLRVPIFREETDTAK